MSLIVTPQQHRRMEALLKANASTIISRAALGSALGQTFGGARDIYTVLGYKKTLTFQDYKDRYDRDHIAGRVVDAYPQATWSHRPQIVVREGAKKKFDTVWKELDERLKINLQLDRLDRVSGIGQFGVLLIGVADGRKVENPIGTVRNPDGVLFLSPYSEDSATINTLDNDTSSPRFGKPESYQIRTDDAGGTSQGKTLTVHHSRIIHVAEGLLENEILGTPRLKGVYNLFDDLMKVVGGSAEFFWRIADRGIQWDIDKDMEMDPDDLADLETEVDEYNHGLSRQVKTRGVTAKVLGSETADPRGPYTGLISLISGRTGIPQRILTGSERGQLASSQDRSSWNERVEERQRIFAGPSILRPFIETLITIKALPKVKFDLEWPRLLPQTEDERSTIAARVANAILNVSKQQQIGEVVVAPSEFREIYLGLDPSTPELEESQEELDKDKEEAAKQAADLAEKSQEDEGEDNAPPNTE